MDKERILDEVKNELHKKITALNFDNVVEKRKEIDDFMDVLERLNVLSFESNESVNPDIKNKRIKPEERNTVSKTNKKSENTVEKLYTFQRKLSGGIIPDLDEGYYLPEKMVRDMNAEDGDKLRVVSKRFNFNQKQYIFEVVEKGNATSSNRQEIRFCKVEEQAGELMISETQDGLILLNDVPHTFILQQRDRLKYNLKDGDIIDIAYYSNNPSTQARVIYKYDVNERPAPTLEKRKLNSEFRHDNHDTEEEKPKRNFPINMNLFMNKSVLVVGGENRHTDYRDTFESLGIELETMSGSEGKKRLEAAINRADVVAIVIGEANHATSVMTVKHCKDIGKPFESTHENGIQSVLLCVEEAIEKGIQQNLIQYEPVRH